jgi:radical SAM superfamily enzyme YgiQ (UPF0313 family)
MNNPEHSPVSPSRVLLASTFSAKHGAAVGESLGSEVIAGHLKGEMEGAVSVDHVDLQLDSNITDLAERIQEEKPHILGISVKIGAVEQVEELVKEVNHLPLEEAEKPVIVMGGVVPTFATIELLETFPNVIMVNGEGENAITGLVEVVKGNKLLTQVPGVTFMENGNLLSTQRLRFDLSRRHLPARITTKRIQEELGGMVWAEASRGCDGNCTFCSVREIHGGGFKNSIPSEQVVDELEQLSQMGIDLVSYTDDDFGGDPDRTLAIAEEIIRRRVNVNFTVSTRADHIWTERLPRSANERGITSLEQYNERLRFIQEQLFQAGLTRVFIGLESGSNTQLRRYGKRISVQGNYKALEILRDIGIDVVAGYIPIDQLMSLKELKENLQFLRETRMYLKVTNPLSVMRVQAGSPYLRLLENKGLLGEQTEDLVFYDAQFEDKRVQKVAELSDRWVNDMYELIFGLKGEVAGKTIRPNTSNIEKTEKVRGILFSFRTLEMDFIEAVTHALSENNGISLGRIVAEFEQKRQGLIEKTAKELKNGCLLGANHRLRKAIVELTR